MERGTELEKFSIEQGLSYIQAVDELPKYLFDNDFMLLSSFNWYKKEVLPKCFKNILTGQKNSFKIFLSDFTSNFSVDELAAGYKQTIIILQSDNFSFRKFSLIPKKSERFTIRFEHLGQDFLLPVARGYKKISLSNHSQLDSQYVLKVQGDPVHQTFLSIPFLQYLENNPKWFMEGSSNSLLVYRRGGTIKSSELQKYLEDILTIGALLVNNEID